MSFFTAVADVYRRTRKPKDIFWNRFVARPAAAVVLVPLQRSSVTPNQITFASLAVFVVAAAILVALPGWSGLLIAVAVIELSYVLDCVDGQLARLRGTSSPVGAHLDFLMDELKAFLLVAATGIRLWLPDREAHWLVEALVGLCAVASAISLTTFVRRQEYLAATGAAPPASAGDYGAGFAPASASTAAAGFSPVRAVESVGRFLIHYPSYLVYVALLDALPWFLHVYVAINAAHAARTLAAVTRKLGRSGR
jgi:phosphatidylglycerophosphate synthase